MPYTRFVHFDAEEIQVRVLKGLLYQRVAITETNFEDYRRAATEDCIEVDCLGTEVDAIRRPEFEEGTLLRRRQASCAPYKSANGTVAGLGFALHAGILFAVSGQCRPLSRQVSSRDSIFAMA